MFKIGSILDGFLNGAVFVLMGDEDPRAGVVQDVIQFPGFHGRVEQHENPAGHKGSEQTHDRLDRVLAENQHPVLAPKAHSGQCAGHAAAHFKKLGIGVTQITADKGCFVREAFGRSYEEIMNEHIYNGKGLTA